ncbi:MAG: indole-3-glycerol phosphate synthase TrpC [Planctomycetota bacterium]
MLEEIVARKLPEVEAAKAARPAADLERALADAPPVRDFVASLRDKASAAADGVALIAEVKRRSPSAGLIREDFDPLSIATTYERHGAACVSVLTDGPGFGGRLEDLVAVRSAIGLPVLRKEFVIDPYQVLEARAAGADAVLLIAECLPGNSLGSLYRAVTAYGMTALVELYEFENVPRVLALDPPLVGVNNRDLRTFVTDLGHTGRVAADIPADRRDGIVLVGESGVRTRDDVRRLAADGCRAVLVGETLMRSDDVGAAVDALIGS